MGAGPTIVAPIPYLARFLNDIAPGCYIPPIWTASDPVAMLREQAADARLALTYGGYPFGEEMLDALPSLEFVQVMGAGYDGLDIAALGRREIRFATAAGLNCTDVADHALGMAIALRRNLPGCDAWIRAGHWVGEQRPPVSHSFSADRAGIVGLGHIGRAIARRLAGFNIPVTWWGPREKPDELLPRASSLCQLARDSTLLFVCCRLSDASRSLIDRDVLDALGPGGILISVARGGVTDEDALISALQAGRIGAAGLDVFWQEPTPAQRWSNVPNVLLSPHHAGLTIEADRASRVAIAENIRRFFAGEELLGECKQLSP